MSRYRRRVLVAAIVLALANAIVLADTTDAERTERMIAELGLIEAPQPVSESPKWRKPKRIVVREATPERLLWLSDAAPGVKLVTAMTPEEAAKLAPGADAVIGYCTPEVLDAGTEIRWIQSYFAGVDSCVAIPAMRKREVLLTNMQKVAGPVMAEHIMAMVLSFARGLNVYADAQRKGEWNHDLVGSERAFTLEGKTMFVAGLGGIGTEVAKRAHALGMTVIATRASNRPAPDYVSRVGNASEQMSMVRMADVVVDTLPLTPQTRGTFNARVFSQMKPTAYFINVGRGGTVVTEDLVAALQAKTIAGAGLDVTDPEPLPPGHPLWKMHNVIITPHVSSNADVDLDKRWLLMRENLRRYVAGERMLSVVDPARGY